MGFMESYDRFVKTNLSFNKYNKSEEFYFGENNPLKTRLIANISHMREVANAVYTKNRQAKPRDVLPDLKIVQEELRKTIIEEFNIENCFIGWQNVTNAACFVQFANADLYGKSKDAKNLRIRLDNIVTNDSKGFHYKDKKGIYYCLILGYNIFAVDEIFTVEEATAVLLHELGHAMQHLVSSLNESVATSEFQMLYQYYENDIDNLSPADRKFVLEYMKKYRTAIRKGDKESIRKLGEDYLDSLEKGDEKGFSEYTDQYIEDSAIRYAPDWGRDTSKSDANKIKNEGKASIGRFLKGIFQGLISVVFSWFFIPTMLLMKSKLNNKKNDEHIYKVFEEAADNFSQIYGMGVHQATALRKLEKFVDYDARSGARFIERVPMLDLYMSFKELCVDMNCCINGYPTYKQRAINLYKAAEFELKNNKDLSPDAKKELQSQIDSYKVIYEEYVTNESTKGWFYKLMAGANRCTLEEAAKKDKFVEEQVLIPLKQRSDPNFNPEDAYKE